MTIVHMIILIFVIEFFGLHMLECCRFKSDVLYTLIRGWLKWKESLVPRPTSDLESGTIDTFHFSTYRT